MRAARWCGVSLLSCQEAGVQRSQLLVVTLDIVAKRVNPGAVVRRTEGETILGQDD